jgi:four helix bundle protein
VEDFKNFKVWQKSHELTIVVYATTRGFPREEVYGITSQLRRAAASIGANIAEGCGRGTDAEMKRFAQIARGSANEVEYLLLLARDLKFLSPSDFVSLDGKVQEIQRMLASLAKRLCKPIAVLASS